MARHPTNKATTRHVNMREFFARQHVELGNIETPFCESADMNADSLSKATVTRTHTRHTARQMGDQSIAPPLTPIHQLVASYLPVSCLFSVTLPVMSRGGDTV